MIAFAPLTLAVCLHFPLAPCAATQEPVNVEDVATLPLEELLRRGREQFLAGDHVGAERFLDAAAERFPSEFEARRWRIRNRLALGRINDALNELDELHAHGERGPRLDVLIGLAFHAKAKTYMGQNADGGAIQMSLEDAVAHLERATAAEPEAFPEAWLPLAEAAWYAQRLPLSRAAAARAVELAPQDAAAHAQLGRTAFSQYQETLSAGEAQAAEEHWRAASAAFERASALATAGEGPAQLALAAEAEKQLAFLHAWKKDEAKVAEHAARALALDGAAIDCSWLLGQFAERHKFIETLATAGKAFAARHGAGHAGDATLRWWLGWARFADQEYGEAEKEFQSAVNKAPSYVNSWHYIALARYHQKDFAGAVEAWRSYWDVAPEGVVESLNTNADQNLAILDWLVQDSFKREDLVAAGELSEMQAETARTNSRYWNNAGLFYRDAGDLLVRKKSEAERAKARGLYERSWAAYQRALALEPDNPAFLNDAAVVLDYNLDRDLERAKEMYARAMRIADELLTAGKVPPAEVEIVRIARRDSENNLRRLEQRLEKRRDENG